MDTLSWIYTLLCQPQVIVVKYKEEKVKLSLASPLPSTCAKIMLQVHGCMLLLRALWNYYYSVCVAVGFFILLNFHRKLMPVWTEKRLFVHFKL